MAPVKLVLVIAIGVTLSLLPWLMQYEADGQPKVQKALTKGGTQRMNVQTAYFGAG